MLPFFDVDSDQFLPASSCICLPVSLCPCIGSIQVKWDIRLSGTEKFTRQWKTSATNKLLPKLRFLFNTFYFSLQWTVNTIGCGVNLCAVQFICITVYYSIYIPLAMNPKVNFEKSSPVVSVCFFPKSVLNAVRFRATVVEFTLMDIFHNCVCRLCTLWCTVPLYIMLHIKWDSVFLSDVEWAQCNACCTWACGRCANLGAKKGKKRRKAFVCDSCK